MKDPIATQSISQCGRNEEDQRPASADYLLALSPYEELWNQVKSY